VKKGGKRKATLFFLSSFALGGLVSAAGARKGRGLARKKKKKEKRGKQLLARHRARRGRNVRRDLLLNSIGANKKVDRKGKGKGVFWPWLEKGTPPQLSLANRHGNRKNRGKKKEAPPDFFHGLD